MGTYLECPKCHEYTCEVIGDREYKCEKCEGDKNDYLSEQAYNRYIEG